MADNAVMGTVQCPWCDCKTAVAKEMRSGAYITCPPVHDGGCNYQGFGRSKVSASKMAGKILKWSSVEMRKKHLGEAAAKPEPVAVEAVEVVAVAEVLRPEPVPEPPKKKSALEVPIWDVLAGRA